MKQNRRTFNSIVLFVIAYSLIILLIFLNVISANAEKEESDEPILIYELVEPVYYTETETEEITPPVYEPPVTDCELIAQVLYGECRYLPKVEQSAVVWTILNRVDSAFSYFPDTVAEVCTQTIKSGNKETPMFAYDPKAPIEEDLYELAKDVMIRWYREKAGETDVGRTLPVEYVYFWGNGRRNFFRIEYQGKNYWDWSLPNPYEEVQP